MHVHLESQEGYGVNLKLSWSNNWPWIGFHLTKQHSSNTLSSPPLLQSSLPGAPLTWLANSRPLKMQRTYKHVFLAFTFVRLSGIQFETPPSSLLDSNIHSLRKEAILPLFQGPGTLVASANLIWPLLLVWGSQSTCTHWCTESHYWLDR